MNTPATDFDPAPAAADTRTAFERAAATADDRAAADLYLKATDEAEAAREWLLAAEAAEKAADRLVNCDPHRAVRLYQRAVASYEQCGHFAAARRMSYREASLKLWRGGGFAVPAGLRAELFAFWLTSGFGLRPLRVLGTAAAVTFGFGLLFWLGDGVRTPAGDPLPDLADALYLSGVTVSTVGYGDVTPARHLRFAAVAEGWLGLMLFGYFVAVLGNRLRH